ncbi:hypothetical protein GYH30_006341 [Glycine max]|nr:hypothetical protein GYH30_006341 [Glycine max]
MSLQHLCPLVIMYLMSFSSSSESQVVMGRDSYIKYEVIEAFSFLSYDVDCECDEDL